MPASEIVSIDVDVVTMESVIDQFGRHRFLAFDRDHGNGRTDGRGRPRGAAVGVGPPPRLDRGGPRRHHPPRGTRRRAHRVGQAERDGDYLLTGNRLAEYERWRTPRRCASPPPSRSTSTPRSPGATTTPRRKRPAPPRERGWPDGHGGGGGRSSPWSSGSAVAGAAVFMFGPAEPPSVAMLNLSGRRQPHRRAAGRRARAGRAGLRPRADPDRPGRSPTSTMSSTTLADAGTDLVLFTDFALRRESRRRQRPSTRTRHGRMSTSRCRLAVAHVRRARGRLPRRRRRGADVTRPARSGSSAACRSSRRALPRRLRSRCPGGGPGDRDPGHLHVARTPPASCATTSPRGRGRDVRARRRRRASRRG